MATFTSRQYPGLRVGAVKFRGGRFSTDDKDTLKELRDYAKRHPERGIEEVDDSSDTSEGTSGKTASGGDLAEASTDTTVAEAKAQHPDLDLDKPAASQETPSGGETVLAQTPEEVEAQAANAAGGEAEDDDQDYESMTVPQLQALAKERGLSKGGNKADLIERLEEDDESDDEDDDEDDAE